MTSDFRLQKLYFFSVLMIYLIFSHVSTASAGVLCSDLFSSNKTNSSELIRSDIPNLINISEISEKMYLDFEVNDLARSIIQRWRIGENRNDIVLQAERQRRFLDPRNGAYYRQNFRPNQVDLRKESEIVLFFSADNIESIAERGFQNLHQTGTTYGGEAGFANRARYEDAFTGIKMGFSEEAKRLRPKSAFVNITSPLELSPTKHRLYSYGPVGAVMRNNIKDRSLISDRDTYLVGYGLTDAKSFVDVNKITSEDLSQLVGSFDRGFVETDRKNDYYYEAIIYGDVTLDDVSSFYFVKENFVNQNRLKLALKKMKKFGKTIDLVEQRMISGRLQLVKIKRLFEVSE